MNDENKIVQSLKTNKIFSNENKEKEISKHFEKKIDVNNAALFYQLSRLFNLPRLSKFCLLFIERCFPMVVESENFLELDYACVKNILLSSELSIDSELEAFNAADAWLRHKAVERGKHAKPVLLTIRLSLLSVATLNFILSKKSVLATDVECVGVIKEVLKSKSSSQPNEPGVRSRCCNQSSFGIVMCGGRTLWGYNAVRRNYGIFVARDVRMINPNDSFAVTTLPPMIRGRKLMKAAVCIKRQVYVFGGVDDKRHYVTSVEKYSFATGTWEKIAKMHQKRRYFCVASFMDSVYILGGCTTKKHERPKGYNTCFEFDTKKLTFKRVADMNGKRFLSACSVLEGRVVVSGGWEEDKSAEAYDHVEDAWHRLPDMCEPRYFHSSVTVRNRMFVVGRNLSSEVYDPVCGKFVLLTHPPFGARELVNNRLVEAVWIGTKMVFMGENEEGAVVVFDGGEWSVESCGLLEELERFSLVKVPLL